MDQQSLVDRIDLILPTFEQATWDYEDPSYLPSIYQPTDFLLAQTFPQSQDSIPQVDYSYTSHHNTPMPPIGIDHAPSESDANAGVIEESTKKATSEVRNFVLYKSLKNSTLSSLIHR
jgi:hypothetical protein